MGNPPSSKSILITCSLVDRFDPFFRDILRLQQVGWGCYPIVLIVQVERNECKLRKKCVRDTSSSPSCVAHIHGARGTDASVARREGLHRIFICACNPDQFSTCKAIVRSYTCTHKPKSMKQTHKEIGNTRALEKLTVFQYNLKCCFINQKMEIYTWFWTLRCTRWA